MCGPLGRAVRPGMLERVPPAGWGCAPDRGDARSTSVAMWLCFLLLLMAGSCQRGILRKSYRWHKPSKQFLLESALSSGIRDIISLPKGLLGFHLKKEDE